MNNRIDDLMEFMLPFVDDEIDSWYESGRNKGDTMVALLLDVSVPEYMDIAKAANKGDDAKQTIKMSAAIGIEPILQLTLRSSDFISHFSDMGDFTKKVRDPSNKADGILLLLDDSRTSFMFSERVS